jgi:hypothetical protein
MGSRRFVPAVRPRFVPELLRTGSSLVPLYSVGGRTRQFVPQVRPEAWS